MRCRVAARRLLCRGLGSARSSRTLSHHPSGVIALVRRLPHDLQVGTCRVARARRPRERRHASHDPGRVPGCKTLHPRSKTQPPDNADAPKDAQYGRQVVTNRPSRYAIQPTARLDPA
jgi:hypothetical protein